MSGYPYSYDELLYRLHTAKTAEDAYKKINLPPLKVTRKNRLSVIVNFEVYSEKLNRSKDHISEYFKVETGACNSVNNQNQLLIHGILNETKCESIMRNYIKEYVMCKQCKGINSSIRKEGGLTYLECHQCLAKTSMGKI
ncbi:eukaryotic translation initiation factor 2 subunit beta [Tupanvirus soda lake]|uniref:Eukaryotic translation initiation factor 2 subunit beta n=1 Tax=Tupanvirus deep ocean TaxID=2126984 RepID=A0AC59HC14_9VIRU|nr:eukaryotic translation initiation factor 2 subunit beta [Tupanvirus soda lake]AUL78086.2 eukaryotic translation initiation factor 2 subunit beta [Tupanvirus soda lake]